MFHRVLATSVIGAAALAAPVTAMAADTGGGGGGAEPAPTAVVVHLPKHVAAGEPITVTARVTTEVAAKDPGGKGADKPGQGEDQPGKAGTGKGHSGTGRHHKGTGHGTKGKKHHKGKGRRHAVTGKIEFFLDGKPEPPVGISHGRASERIEIPLGRHTIVAQYSGDDEHLAAKSNPVSFELTAGQDGQGQQSTGDVSGNGNGSARGASVGTSAQAGDWDHDPDYPTLGQDTQDPGFDQDQGDREDWGDQDGQDQDQQGSSQDTPNQSGDEEQI
jgi:hypothetical protein